MVSLKGLVKNISEVLNDPEVKEMYPHSGGFAYTLEEMAKNMEELKARKKEGEKVIDEFFSLYV